MTMHKFEMCLTKGIGKYNLGDLQLTNWKPSKECCICADWGKVILKEFILDVDVDDVDTRAEEIAALEAAVSEERAESQVRVNFLLDRISKLKCITHEVDADGVPV